MLPPSLQTLPPHIIREIIHYVAETKAKLSTTLAGPVVRYSLLWPLLHSCRAWRELALSVLFSRFEIAAGSQTSMTYLMNESTEQTVFHLSKTYTLLVRNIYLKLNLKSIVDGTALAGIQNSAICSACFTKARLLDVELIIDDDVKFNLDSIYSIQNFMKYIEYIIPAADNIVLYVFTDKFYASYDHSKGVGSLLSNLFDVIPIVNSNVQSASWTSYTKPIIIPELTSVSCYWDNNSPVISRILHANSHSLVYLQLCFLRGDNIELLLLDEQKQPVVYSNLKSLAMIKEDEFVTKQKALQNFVPFPCLKALYMDIEYPFENEILFKGNSLDCITIQVNDHTINILEKCQLFSKKNPAIEFGLHSVAYIMDSFIEYRESATEKNMNFTCKALTFAKGATISDILISEALPRHLAANPIVSNIKFLYLSCFLKLPNILQLIKSLPTLQSLNCMVSDSDRNATRLNSAELLNTLQTEFDLSASGLKKWSINNKGYFPSGPIIASILIAVTMCSRLEVIVFPKQKIEPILHLFRRMQLSKLYFQHKADFTSKLVKNSPVPMLYFRHKSAALELTKD